MKYLPKISIACATVAAAILQTCLAQASAPVTRAEVKAETLQAEKAHQIIPAGETGTIPAAPSTKSTYTKAQSKAAVLKARKEGKLLPPGEQAAEQGDASLKATRSEKTRAQQKAETVEAAKAHQLTPAGEGTNSNQAK